MSQSKTVRVLVYTHPMVIFGAAALILVALVAVVVLVVAAVMAVYASVLFVVGESLWRQMSPPKPKKWLVTNLSELLPRPVLALGFHDFGERVSWPEEIRGDDLLACDFDDGLAVMDGEKRLEGVEFGPLKLNQAEGLYGWTSLDLPTEPTPTAVLGHDEHGKGEIIVVTPDLQQEEHTTPKPLVLTAPSANRITTATRKRKPVDWPALLQAARSQLAAGQTLRAVARDLGVPESTLRNRIKKVAVQMVEAAGYAQ
jgi:hypothetical protein